VSATKISATISKNILRPSHSYSGRVKTLARDFRCHIKLIFPLSALSLLLPFPFNQTSHILSDSNCFLSIKWNLHFYKILSKKWLAENRMKALLTLEPKHNLVCVKKSEIEGKLTHWKTVAQGLTYVMFCTTALRQASTALRREGRSCATVLPALTTIFVNMANTTDLCLSGLPLPSTFVNSERFLAAIVSAYWL